MRRTTVIRSLLLVDGSFGNQIGSSLENRDAQMRIILHFFLEGCVASHLAQIGHYEFNTSTRQSLGIEILRGPVHSSHRMDRHVMANELVFHKTLQVSEEPFVRQMQYTKQVIRRDATDLLDSIRVNEFQHVRDMGRGKRWINLNSAFFCFFECFSGHFPIRRRGSLTEEGLEIICSSRQDALVGPNFYHVAGVFFLVTIFQFSGTTLWMDHENSVHVLFVF
mmetsp:Transcript_19847/g.32018  ORF Transcript_19847/g.32018 Transcript_19847/m.32018 type:complete len:222 (+) Transcript_19847:933-1598(+)